MWVPSQWRYESNKTADGLAKNSVGSRFIGPDLWSYKKLHKS